MSALLGGFFGSKRDDGKRPEAKVVDRTLSVTSNLPGAPAIRLGSVSRQRRPPSRDDSIRIEQVQPDWQ